MRNPTGTGICNTIIVNMCMKDIRIIYASSKNKPTTRKSYVKPSNVFISNKFKCRDRECLFIFSI